MMRRLVTTLLVALLAAPAWSAVAFDAYSGSGTEADPNWTHTPSGTPAGVIVSGIVSTGVSVGTVTYGGTAMTAVTGSPLDKTTGETAQVVTFFLGASVPTGAQTVAMDFSGAFGRGHAVTLTAADDTEVNTTCTIESDSLENPSCTLSLGGTDSFCSITLASGQNAATGITPLSGWTERNESAGGGQSSAIYTYDTVASIDVTAGWTQTAEDATAIAVAINEVAAGGVNASQRNLRGQGR